MNNTLYEKSKSAGQQTEEFTPDAHDLALINKYTLKQMQSADLFVFKAAACDNEVDRDIEAFNERTLKQLRNLIIGKPVISDHENSAKGQCARIYAAQVKTNDERQTSYGAPYSWLEVKCYMPRTPDTQAEITAIESGIRKEMSIRYRVAREICSVCGSNYWSCDCEHQRGQTYQDGKLCFVIQEDAQDAGELSFVAIPAQPAAGVTKAKKENFGFERQMEDILSAVKALGAQLRQMQPPQQTAGDKKAVKTPVSEPIDISPPTAELLGEVQALLNETLN